MKTFLKTIIQPKGLLAVLSLMLCLTSCNTNVIGDFEEDEHLESAELAHAVVNDVLTCMNGNNVTFDDILYLLKKYDNQISIAVGDSMMVISMPDGYRLDVDLYGLSLLQPSDDDVDYSQEIEAIMADMAMNLGLTDDDDSDIDATYTSRHSAPDIPEGAILTRSGNNDVLVNRDILIWAPEDRHVNQIKSSLTKISQDLVKTLKNKKMGLNIKKVITGMDCTPSSMKTFNNYGLVFIAAHGHTPGVFHTVDQNGNILEGKDVECNGELLIPAPTDYETSNSQLAKEMRELQNKHYVVVGEPEAPGQLFYALNKDDLKSVLPNLSQTIIWTCVCYAQNEGSHTKLGIESKSPTFFAGATGRTTIGPPLNKLIAFSPKFYAGEEAEETWKSTAKQTGYTHTYLGKKVYVVDHISAQALQPKESKPRVSVLSPQDHQTSSFAVKTMNAARSTRATSHSNDQVGIQFKNKETGDKIEFLLDESRYTIEKVYEYKGLAHYIMEINTDELESGTYEYRTYQMVDGKKDYSNVVCEFTTSRITDVVPPEILALMEPHMPIYKGDNPPIVNGLYALTPMVLEYNSDPSSSYRPGKVVADEYIFLGGQDQENDTIYCYMFSMNSSGKVLEEKIGMGAFISGEGKNFSVYFNTYGTSYRNENYTVTFTEAIIISGTKESDGIRNIRYSFVMVDKDDPYGNLMNVGEFRVYKDGDGFSDYIELDDVNKVRSFHSKAVTPPMLPPCTDSGKDGADYRGIPFDTWKKATGIKKNHPLINQLHMKDVR